MKTQKWKVEFEIIDKELEDTPCPKLFSKEDIKQFIKDDWEHQKVKNIKIEKIK